MATKNEENWMMHYNELKAYVAVHHHFPDKHKVEFRGLLNWAKYTRKKIKAGTCRGTKTSIRETGGKQVEGAYWWEKEKIQQRIS